MKGKVPPDDGKDIMVKFICNAETSIEGDIIIKIRGGKILKLPF